MAAGGDAIAREPGGRVVFVEGAIVGELVRVELTSSKRDFAKGVVVEVLEASPDRVAPPCPHVARGCGGCGWQHIAPVRQLELKRELVADALRRQGGLPEALVELGPPLPAHAFRTTARLGTDRAGTLGFRAAKSHRIVPIDDCMVLHPGIEALLGARVPGADEVVLRIGAATGERSARWDGPGRPEGFPDDVRLGDDAIVHERVGPVEFRVSARSFFQSSPEAAEALGAAVIDVLGDEVLAAADHVVDAYGGVGLFSATVVPHSTPVTLVELSASSCADARVNLAGRPASVVELGVEQWSPTPAGIVIADPARAGLGREGATVLAATGAERFVLVSCDVAAAGRDVRLLSEAGYVHHRSVVLDPFPHTAHVEVVTLLTRGGSGRPS